MTSSSTDFKETLKQQADKALAEQASGGEVHRFLLSDLRVVRYHRPPSAGASAQRLPLQATTDNEYSHTCFQS